MSLLRIFRVVGALEGVSFLVLLGIAMPLKYLGGQPQAVSMVGAVHGALFVLYSLVLLRTAAVHGWSMARLATGFVAAVLPFGPFVFDARIRREEAAIPARR